MSKDKSKVKEVTDTPNFGGFTVITTGFEQIAPEPIIETIDDVKTGADDGVIVEDTIVEEITPESIVEETIVETTEEEIEPSAYKGFVKELYNKGVVDFDDTFEEFEESEEGIAKIVDKTVENRINKWQEGLNPEFVKFLEFTQSGGNPKQFLDIYYGNHSWENYSIDTEENQKLVVAESLRQSGESEEDIQDIVTEWFDNGTLEKRATSAIKKLQKNEQAQKEELVEIQKQYSEKQRKAQQDYWDNFKNELYNKDEILGFKLTPKLKDKLWDFISVPDKRTGRTAYQEAVENKNEATLLFALQAMNDFDINALEKQVKTKVSGSMSKLLKNYKSGDTKTKMSSGSTASYEDNNPFSAFKNI